MPATLLDNATADGKDLVLVCVDRTASDARVPSAVHAIWKELAPWATHARHVAYVRDLREQSIEGKWPGGFCYDPQELFVALPAWSADDDQITGTIAHEAHHMIRWGHRGMAHTLGDTLVSEGLPAYTRSATLCIPPGRRKHCPPTPSTTS